MRKLVLIAAMLMASASAHAGGFSFKVEGQQVRINIPRGRSSLSCINVAAPGWASDKFEEKETPRRPRASHHRDRACRRHRRPRRRLPRRTGARAGGCRARTGRRAADIVENNGFMLPRPLPTADACRFCAVPDCAGTFPAAGPSAPARVQVAAAPAAAPAGVQTSTSPLGVWLSEEGRQAASSRIATAISAATPLTPRPAPTAPRS